MNIKTKVLDKTLFQKKTTITVITVLKNLSVYNRCVKNNIFNKSNELVVLDNREKNENLTILYNEFLDNYDYTNQTWFVFCHEDWQLKEDLNTLLKKLDRDCLYGPIGVPMNLGILLYSNRPIGQIENSDKDGNKYKINGSFVKRPIKVGTFDCQCLIVHSSLVKKHKLRFDEKLSFDLYVEDFCINANERHNIPSMVIQIKCQHFSWGSIQPRFHQQYKYLQEKYVWSKNFYITTCSGSFIGSKKPLKRFLFRIANKIFKFIYRKKQTKDGIIVKIFKIPVFYKKTIA